MNTFKTALLLFLIFNAYATAAVAISSSLSDNINNEKAKNQDEMILLSPTTFVHKHHHDEEQQDEQELAVPVKHRFAQSTSSSLCHENTDKLVFVTENSRLFGLFYAEEYNRCVYNKEEVCTIDFQEKFASRYPIAAAECNIMMTGGIFFTYDIILNSCGSNDNKPSAEAPSLINILGYPQCVSSSCVLADYEGVQREFPNTYYCKHTYMNAKREASICDDKKGGFKVGDYLNTVTTCAKVSVNIDRWCTYPSVQEHCGTTCKTCSAIGTKYCGDYREKFDPAGNDKNGSYMKKCWQIAFNKKKWCSKYFENVRLLCPKTCGVCSSSSS